MATQAQIDKVRFYINDDGLIRDFTNQQISDLIDEKNSINYAVYNLALILITRLRKELLVSDTTGAEKTDLAPLRERLTVLKSIYDDYKELYENENNN